MTVKGMSHKQFFQVIYDKSFLLWSSLFLWGGDQKKNIGGGGWFFFYLIMSVTQLSSAINYLSHFPAAPDMYPSMSSSTSMTSSHPPQWPHWQCFWRQIFGSQRTCSDLTQPWRPFWPFFTKKRIFTIWSKYIGSNMSSKYVFTWKKCVQVWKNTFLS